MDSIITPAAIAGIMAAVVSLAGAFCKELWFDRKSRKRETKILAIRIHYILCTYIIKCKRQFEETMNYMMCEEIKKEYGYVRQVHYQCDMDIPLIVVDVEKINWIDLDMEVILFMHNIANKIDGYREAVSYACRQREEIDNDEPDTDYDVEIFIEKMVKLLMEITDILEKLEAEYDIDKAIDSINGKTLKEVILDYEQRYNVQGVDKQSD